MRNNIGTYIFATVISAIIIYIMIAVTNPKDSENIQEAIKELDSRKRFSYFIDANIETNPGKFTELLVDQLCQSPHYDPCVLAVESKLWRESWRGDLVKLNTLYNLRLDDYIWERRVPGSEQLLIDILFLEKASLIPADSGSITKAMMYVQSRNIILADGAREWAKANGFAVTPGSDGPNGGLEIWIKDGHKFTGRCGSRCLWIKK